MTTIFEIISSVAATTSKNAKIEILKNNQSNETLKRVFSLTLNPLINFFQRKIPSYNPSGLSTIDIALDSLEMLSSREITGNAAIEYLSGVLSSLNEEDAKVVEMVVLKDLRCGVAASTANLVWKGLVSEYPCMLASAYSQKLVDKIRFPAMVQIKSDGMRFNALVKNGQVEFRSRNGKEVQILDQQFHTSFIKMASGDNIVFDGELLVLDEHRSFCDRKTGNGILNKAVRGTISEEESSRVVSQIWDVIPYDVFRDADTHKVPYSTRFEELQQRVELDTTHRVEVIDTTFVDSIEEAKSLFQMYLDQGQEGIILKSMDGPWENKRSQHQIKFKAELDCDLRCVGWREGVGKYTGMLGALLLESADGKVKVSVGSGFTDHHRQAFTPENTIGKIIAVKYNEIIKDKNADHHSLFLPIFLEVREDKDEADTFKTL